MLVLSRKPGQGIVITAPDGTELKVYIGKREGVFKLCIDAPEAYHVTKATDLYSTEKKL